MTSEDLVRSFIFDRSIGVYELEEFIEYARLFHNVQIDREEALRILKEFDHPAVKINVKDDKFEVIIASPDELLAMVLERNVGKTLKDVVNEFRKLFGEFEPKWFTRILRIHGSKYRLKLGDKVVPMGIILDVTKRLEAELLESP